MKTVASFFQELRRRGVLQTIAMYIVGAWIILQASDVLFPGAGIPDTAIKYVFVGAVLGFPLVLVFGWMYDISGKGVHRTPDVLEADHGGLPLRRFDVALLSGLAVTMLALIGGVSAKVLSEVGLVEVIEDEFPAAENSIAVLPFVNLSDDAENEYFGDGMAEELLNQLANLTSLQVAARTSSFYFKGKNEPVQSIGRQLGVRTVLEGSVRRAGNKIRVTAQLINAADGYHLWSNNFDREVGDVFAIQEEIARAITESLKIEIQGKESRQLATVPTESFEAYDFYLLGQHYREKRNPEDLDKSIELFQKALALDDRFALGYTALALSYLYQAYYDDLPAENVAELTNPLLERALELDPNLAKTYSTRASIRLLLGDFKTAEAGYRSALELQPNYSGAWANLGFSLVRQSRLKEAAQAYDKSETLDPLNANMKFNIGALHMLTGRYDDGLEAFKAVMRLAPARTRTENAIVYWSTAYGRYEVAAHWMLKVLAREPDSASTPAALGQIYANLAMWDESLEAISRAYEKSPENFMNINALAAHYYLTNDHAALTEFVTREYEKMDPMAPSRHSPTTGIRYFWHGIAALLEGNYVQAAHDLTDAAGGEEGIADAVYDEINALKYLAFTYQKQGRDADAELLLQRCLDLAQEALEQGWATPTIYYRTARVYALLGDTDSTMSYLRTAVDKGWRIAASLERDPLWSGMQDDAGFQNIVIAVNSDIQRQREKVAQVMSPIAD